MSRLPNLIVIGAMKCGTTSLHAYLDAHPQISMARKELNFFVTAFNWNRGIEWYREQFAADAPVRGDTSPEYSMHPVHPGVAQRMHDIVPDARLIYLVRHPIDRLLAHYRHVHASRDEDRPLEDALADLNDNRYLVPSQYYFQLEQYLQYFPADRILIVKQDDLLYHRRQTMRHIFTFLGVEPEFWSWRFQTERHRSRDKRRPNRIGAKVEQLAVLRRLQRISPSLHWHLNRMLTLAVSQPEPPPELSAALRGEILRRLEPDIDALERFTGFDLSGWRV